MSYIHSFISNLIGRYAETNKTHLLSKSDVKNLIEYLKDIGTWSTNIKDKAIGQLKNMEMLMEGKEKASFYFW